MEKPNLEAIGNNLPSVPDYVSSAAESNSVGFNWLWVLGILVVVVLILLIIFRRRMFRRKSSDTSFYELYDQGINFIDKKDFENAKVVYNKMKNIAEKKNSKELREKVISLYNYYDDSVKKSKI
jgi:beta-lactamase regulating signal transducer with metallopeptidase domain